MIIADNLYPQQKIIIQAKTKYIMVYGGVGTFKTSGALLRVYYHCHEWPGQNIFVFAQTLDQIREIYIQEWEKQIPADRYRMVGNVILLPHVKSRIRLLYADHKEAKTRIRGSTISGYHIIQAESIKDENFYYELEKRVRLGARDENFSSHFYLRIIDANPGSPNHWTYTHFVDDKSEKFIAAGEVKDQLTRIRVETTPESSAFSAETLAEWKRVHSDIEYKRMVKGLYVGSEDAVFEIDELIHVKKFEISFKWDFWLFIDHGFANPFCCLLVGIENNERVYVIDEIYQAKLLPTQRAEIIRAGLLPKYGLALKDFSGMVCDESPASDKATMEDELALYCPIAVRDREFGRKKITQWLALREDGKPGVIIHKRCVTFKGELMGIEWQKSTDGKKEDTKKINDHGYDALRIGLATLFFDYV